MTLLEDVLRADDYFDAPEITARFPWFITDGLDCIISTDADGQLCGLLLSYLQGWNIRGFYDGKAMVVDHRVDPRDCVFADVEIFREGVRSFGNHMLLYNANRKPNGWDERLRECLAINEWRGHDRLHHFRRKYPFATIHFLLILVAQRHPIDLAPSAAGPLLFADGVYKLLLQYTENAWDWMRYLRVDQQENPLHGLFHSESMSMYAVMTEMLHFWEKRDELSEIGHRGDRIAITERGGDGSLMNLERDGEADVESLWRYANAARARIEQFLDLLGGLTGWQYNEQKWSWSGWRVFEFDKGIDPELTNQTGFNVPCRKPTDVRRVFGLRWRA